MLALTQRPPVRAGDTIVAIPKAHPLASLCVEPAEVEEAAGTPTTEALFKIRLANSEGRRSTTSYLIQRRYAWRGYSVGGLDGVLPNRVTLSAFDDDEPMATISVGLDSAVGLGVEDLFPEEVRSLRQAGARLCEFTRLAVDSAVRSKPVLAAIFHIAYIYGHRIRGASDVVIEVNPRHVRFYQAMLGFERCGPERMDPRVGAPGILLRLPLSHAEAQIARYGGHRELADQTRLLYPYFFSEAEERGIEGRLRAMG